MNPWSQLWFPKPRPGPNFTPLYGEATSQHNFFLTFGAVGDPGFPIGGVDLVWETLTPEAVTFQKFCMLKRKNLDPSGPGTPPRSANDMWWLPDSRYSPVINVHVVIVGVMN